MSQSQKRKRPASGLAEFDQAVLNIIKSKGESAIAKRNLQQEANLSGPIITKCINNLKSLSLIKEIPHAQLNVKCYIATEFKPSNTVTGGEWYLDGKLDTQFIDQLKGICLKIVKQLKVTTAEGVYEFFKKYRLTNADCTSQQISEILRTMVLENLIIEVKSTGHGHGEYHLIPVGNVCYRCPVGNLNQGLERGAMALIPCGVCPRIRYCTPDGLISPGTCVYYAKWLDF
ncbi:hypothetical protein L1987_26272 [Smallanthus sonchifolius]|uniref:Uncharacterized protein n=1 Tax=Smallanthus sonchifolius TaxID=185202 RepID=A0ACB9IBZ9_9ASTR|nr:hypothetical protein L1987_26272 [Smallanthus sonchifolius]